jgi:hypothetical protein
VFRKPSPPVLDQALRRKVVVNFLSGHGSFAGHLGEYDDKTYVLESCETIAAPGETPRPIAGRQFVDRALAFLQELPS